MILNRLGNKKLLANKIYKHFPKHEVYMEPFFGAGGMFFNKPKVKYNFLNDIDSDVYNLFRQVIDNKDELLYYIKITPIDERQFKEWGKGKREKSDVLNAVRFLWLSNFGLYGKPDTLRTGLTKPKNSIISSLDKTFLYMKDVYFFNADFRDFFKKMVYKKDVDKCFCYCDPPYQNTGDNYSDSFTEKDLDDLIIILKNSKVRFAISEFDSEIVLKLAKKHNLNVINIGERFTIKNRQTEILLTNYETYKTLFD